MTNAVRLWQDVSVDDRIGQAVRARAPVAFSLSGGKDSTAAAHAASAELDAFGHPRERRIAIHADLGRAEWRSTAQTVAGVARSLGVELLTVRHNRHDMVSRWEARFEEGKRRYSELEVFNLIGPWSSSSLRFCTSELKQQVIAPALQRRWPGQTIVSVVGIRRDESPARRLAPVSKHEPRWDRADGTRLLTWHPILDWTASEVFCRHVDFSLPLHEAYATYGATRLSCAFCVMQSAGDQVAAARAPDNRELLVHLAEMEVRSTFSFQRDRWLADVAPGLLPPSLLAEVPAAKVRADLRRELEGSLPAGLRYVKGWPLRAPTMAEAAQIVAVRDVILDHHGLTVRFPTPESVCRRFEQLLAANKSRLAA